MKNADTPISPSDHTFNVGLNKERRETYTGLTKREHFAGLAMQGQIAYCTMDDPWEVAKDAVKFADALLEALEE